MPRARGVERWRDARAGKVVGGIAGVVVADLKRNIELTTSSMIELALEAAAKTDERLRGLGSGEGVG
jgi:hypothetical protein